jgi:hypothetical protein
MTRENRYDSIKSMHSQACEHLCTHNKRFEKGEKALVHAECIHIYGHERILPRHNKSVKEETMKRVTPLFVLSLTGCLRVASPFSSCTGVYEPLAMSSADGPHHVSDSMFVVPRNAIGLLDLSSEAAWRLSRGTLVSCSQARTRISATRSGSQRPCRPCFPMAGVRSPVGLRRTGSLPTTRGVARSSTARLPSAHRVHRWLPERCPTDGRGSETTAAALALASPEVTP